MFNTVIANSIIDTIENAKTTISSLKIDSIFLLYFSVSLFTMCGNVVQNFHITNKTSSNVMDVVINEKMATVCI